MLGFECIADLMAQPRAPLALRFGPEIGRRLDQALGHVAEPIAPIRPAELIEVRRSFAEPITAAETIARYIGKLVVRLCAALEAKGLGARRLDLICHRVDNRAQAVRVGTALPIRDVKRLTRLLCDKIETIEPGFGIEILSLAATLAEPFNTKQLASRLVEDRKADVSDLIDVLANRVGEHRLYRASPVVSDVPERSVRRIPAMAPEMGATWPGHWPRPSRLLATPEPIETVALLPDHPPVSFAWRGIRRRVKRADGPERVFGEWWKATPSWRPYGTIFGSRTTLASATGSSDLATARMLPPDRIAGSCMGCSDERPPLRGASSHFAFQLPARCVLLRGAVRPGVPARHRSSGHRRPQLVGRRRKGARGGQDHGHPPHRWLPSRPRRWRLSAGLPDRSTSLCTALPIAVARQATKRQGQVPSRMERSCRLRGGSDRRPCPRYRR